MKTHHPLHISSAVALGLALLLGGLAQAQEMPLVREPAAAQVRSFAPPPLRLADRAEAQPMASLETAERAAPGELEAIVLWNRAGQLPAKTGFTRPLAQSRRVTFGPEELNRALGSGVAEPYAGGLLSRTVSGDLVWGTEVRVAGAWRLRLHLEGVELPPGTRMWVYGTGEEVRGPAGMELRSPDGGLWTPSVGGEVLRLELQIPAASLAVGSAGFVVDKVGQLFRLDDTGAPITGISLGQRIGECIVDAQCNAMIPLDSGILDQIQQAIAAIQFEDGGSFFVCSGGLLNNNGGPAPFFLTANHCFSNQAAASSVEAFWDYYTASCNGAPPNIGSLPTSNGSLLRATGSSSDYTLIEFFDFPDANRVLLGWNANTVAATDGTVVHRVSHPFGEPQHYSRNRVDDSALTCGGAPRPDFLYETFNDTLGDIGGTFGGSSGAPLLLPNGQTVGQLTGGCGPNPSDGCDYNNAEVDGAFSQSFNALGPILTATGGGGCTPSPTTLCLQNDRFSVEIEWTDFGGITRDAEVVQGVQTDDSGLFFFRNEDNWEFLIKVLNSCSFNDHYWVFFAATTNVEFEVTVTDTQTSEIQTYFNPLSHPADAITDTAAFATCP